MKKTTTGTPPHQRTRVRREFRWGIVGIPLALGTGWWLLRSCAARKAWAGAADGHIPNHAGFAQLAMLGIVPIAIAAVTKVIGGRGTGHGPGGRP